MSNQHIDMSEQLMIPVFDPLASVIVRDSIVESLQDKSIDDLVAEIVEDLANWQDISDPIARQAAKRLTLLLDEEEREYYVWNFISSHYPIYAVDLTSDRGYRTRYPQLGEIRYKIAIIGSDKPPESTLADAKREHLVPPAMEQPQRQFWPRLLFVRV